MVHVMGWIWILLGRKRENGWFTRYSEFTGRSRDSLYPYYASVYFITTTVTTVGYGDILPYENLEILFIMVLELIGLVTFSYILGTFTSVEGSDSAETIIANKQDDIKEFLNKVDQNKSETELPQEIYNSSLENLDLIHDYGVKFVMNLFGFYEQLNPRLRNKFAYANLKNIYIKFIDFFVNKDLHFQSDDKFILRFLSNLEWQVFLPNKTIIERGEQLDWIYLIAKGSVHVYSHRQGNLLTVLPKGCFFGDYQIFLDAGSNVSYYASPEEKVFVYTLHKSIFLEIWREYENHLDFYMKRALETRKLFKRLIIKNNAFYVSSLSLLIKLSTL